MVVKKESKELSNTYVAVPAQIEEELFNLQVYFKSTERIEETTKEIKELLKSEIELQNLTNERVAAIITGYQKLLDKIIEKFTLTNQKVSLLCSQNSILLKKLQIVEEEIAYIKNNRGVLKKFFIFLKKIF